VTTDEEHANAAQLDSIAAVLQADTRDANVFFPVLCEKLSGALPESAVVEHQHALSKKKRQARKITITFGDDMFDAELSQGVISCRHVHSVRGIGGGLPYSKQLELNDWIAAVLDSLAHQAETSAAATAALRSLVT
jgi:hypothetical protein